MAKRALNAKLQAWVEARRRHKLSHAHVQMARELGMSPRTLGKLDNHHQQRWKMPLPAYLEHLYLERFGRERPEVVRSIEELARRQREKRAARKERAELRSAQELGAGHDPDVARSGDASGG